MKKRSYRQYEEKKRQVSGKKVAGIDPAKEKHQVMVLDEEGLQMGSSFSIPASREGYDGTLWKKLSERLGSCSPDDLVFAVETACGLWDKVTKILSCTNIKRGIFLLH